MMKSKISTLLSYFLLTACILEAKNESVLLGKEQEHKIAVDNKILAKINGKSISTVDIMKKMNMLFYRQFPQYVSSPEARFQYYQVNWKHVLEEFIDKELVLADAAESKIEVSSGDIRQEMESYFGPNIIENLDKVGLSFDEASKMVQDEITIRRMMMYRANSKAIRLVTPAHVRQAYDDYSKDPKNIRAPQWNYQVISIRGPNEATNLTIANEAYRLLNDQKIDLNDLSNQLTKNKVITEDSKLSVSEEFRHQQQEMSDAYKDILLGLTPKSFSNPIMQKSRADKSTVYRIFYLKNKEEGGVPSFKELESKIKDKLISDSAEKETADYIKRLHKHYHVQESDLNAMVAPDYQPFTLR